MVVDDASTLPKGGAKLEAGWRKADDLHGFDAAAGLAPLDGLELGLDGARLRGDEGRATALGAEVKWIPLQSDEGLSAGLKIGFDQLRFGAGDRPRGWSALALVTWTFDQGPRLHVNAGSEWVRARDARGHALLWGVGWDVPLVERLSVTAEAYGARHASPGRALGLRYEVVEGLKLSAAAGYRDHRVTANAGLAWEF